MKDDTIKRSDAIKVVSIPCETCLARDSKDCEKCSVPKLNELINAIPSADRPQGCWFYSWSIFSKGYECTNCHKKAIAEYDYCPNCGADMRIKKDK